ncbi:MAG: LysM peptidoglycan-binding domain-containing protein [Planctomycetota bacterium]
MHRRRLIRHINGRVFLPVLLLGLVGGCVSPRVTFLRVAASRVQQDGELQAVSFSSSIQTEGLAGQQIIYRVGLVNSKLRPLKSLDRRFQNPDGTVGASRALMVHEYSWTFEDVKVTIPVSELEIQAQDLPVLAVFGIYLPGGERLAQETTVVPVYDAPQAPLQLEAGPDVVDESQPPEVPDFDIGPKTGSQTVLQQKVRRDKLAKGQGTRKADTNLTMRPAEEPATPDSPYLPEWWRSTTKRLESRVTDSMHGFLKVERPKTIPSDKQSGEQQTPTTRPVAPPASQPVPAKPAPSPTSAPATKPEVQERGADEQPEYRWYVVQSGDTLWEIAAKQLGDASRWDEIYELNRVELTSPAELQVGTKLRIPIDQAESP